MVQNNKQVSHCAILPADMDLQWTAHPFLKLMICLYREKSMALRVNINLQDRANSYHKGKEVVKKINKQPFLAA